MWDKVGFKRVSVADDNMVKLDTERLDRVAQELIASGWVDQALQSSIPPGVDDAKYVARKIIEKYWGFPLNLETPGLAESFLMVYEKAKQILQSQGNDQRPAT